MPSNEYTRAVDMLKAFERDPELSGTSRLAYPNLEKSALESVQKEGAIWREFFKSEEGSVLKEDRARALRLGHIVLAGYLLQQCPPEHQQLIANQLTKESKDLYGEPESEEFQWLIQTKITEFSGYQDNPLVDQAYVN